MKNISARFLSFASLTLLGAASCNNGTGGGSGTGATTSASTDVSGTMIDRYHGEGPPLDHPVDLTGVQVEALLREGSTWKTFPGAGHADGSFTIPAVPMGGFLLHVAGTYVYTAARTIDLGSDLGGRPDAVPSTGATHVAGNLQNVEAWQVSDTVEWLDANASSAAYGFSGGPPSAGATALKGEPARWLGALVDASKGDVLYATQLSTHTAAGVEYLALARFLSLEGVEQKDGSTTTLSGAFTSVTADQTLAVDFRASEFAKLGSAVHPGVGAGGAMLSLSTLPGASSVGAQGYPTDLIQLLRPDESDANLGTVPYANPFPSAWGAFVLAGESWPVSFMPPGASAAVGFDAGVYVVMPPSKANAGPIRPGVSPVQGLLVDGKDAFGSLDGISTTPTISWMLPAVGTPTAYDIVVNEIVVESGTPRTQQIADITSIPTTSISVPPNLLQHGHVYVLTITALVLPIDASTAPFRGSPTTAFAQAVTSMAMP